MTDMHREDFERIAKGIGYTLFSRVPDDQNYKSGRRGKYKDHMLEIAWEGWQAAIRTHHAEIARDREKLKALEQAIRESKAQWFKTQSGVTNWIESRATEIMQENQNAKTL